MRAPATVLSLLLFTAMPLDAQRSFPPIAPRGLCFRARPKPECSAFLLTQVGVYGVAPVESYRSRLRAVGDWGFMINVSQRAAIGASVFLSLDEAGGALGPAARYRRWWSPQASIEFALGTPLLHGEMKSGSILGLVRWSPASWIAVTARPELLRREVFSPTTGQNIGLGSRGRGSIGVEVGEGPGLILTGAGILAAAVLVLLFAGSGFGA